MALKRGGDCSASKQANCAPLCFPSGSTSRSAAATKAGRGSSRKSSSRKPRQPHEQISFAPKWKMEHFFAYALMLWPPSRTDGGASSVADRRSPKDPCGHAFRRCFQKFDEMGGWSNKERCVVLFDSDHQSNVDTFLRCFKYPYADTPTSLECGSTKSDVNSDGCADTERPGVQINPKSSTEAFNAKIFQDCQRRSSLVESNRADFVHLRSEQSMYDAMAILNHTCLDFERDWGHNRAFIELLALVVLLNYSSAIYSMECMRFFSLLYEDFASTEMDPFLDDFSLHRMAEEWAIHPGKYKDVLSATNYLAGYLDPAESRKILPHQSEVKEGVQLLTFTIVWILKVVHRTPVQRERAMLEVLVPLAETLLLRAHQRSLSMRKAMFAHQLAGDTVVQLETEHTLRIQLDLLHLSMALENLSGSAVPLCMNTIKGHRGMQSEFLQHPLCFGIVRIAFEYLLKLSKIDLRRLASGEIKSKCTCNCGDRPSDRYKAQIEELQRQLEFFHQGQKTRYGQRYRCRYYQMNEEQRRKVWKERVQDPRVPMSTIKKMEEEQECKSKHPTKPNLPSPSSHRSQQQQKCSPGTGHRSGEQRPPSRETLESYGENYKYGLSVMECAAAVFRQIKRADLMDPAMQRRMEILTQPESGMLELIEKMASAKEAKNDAVYNEALAEAIQKVMEKTGKRGGDKMGTK